MNARSIMLISTVVFCSVSPAWANWREDNPNQPNGYEASMLRYHYGTPDDDGPHDGYRATTIRNKHGLDRFAPPDGDDDGGSSNWSARDSGDASRWGGGSRMGNQSSWGGGGLGRHFRQGQAEGEEYWRQHLQQRMAAGMQGNFNGYANAQNMPAQSYAMNNFSNQQFNRGFNYAQAANPNQTTGNYQYAPTQSFGPDATALRYAVQQRPIATLLRNSRGGFNRIYTPGQ